LGNPQFQVDLLGKPHIGRRSARISFSLRRRARVSRRRGTPPRSVAPLHRRRTASRRAAPGGARAKPCMHHTLTHAKALADALDAGAPPRANSAPASREASGGIRYFPEIATWLAERGPWRATVTRNDWLYQPGVWHPTGGAISLALPPQSGASLSRQSGGVCSGGSAEHATLARRRGLPADAQSGNALWRAGSSSTLYDTNAAVQAEDNGGVIAFAVEAELRDSSGAGGGRSL